MALWNDTWVTWNDATATWSEVHQEAWAEHAARRARTPCIVVEIDLDWIDDPGVTATNPDGSLCYRTPATTDQGAFAVTTRTVRFVSSDIRAIPELGAIPCLKDAKMGGEEVRIGRGLGYFGQASITLMDFVDNDARAEDPFATDASRTGLDLSAGTFFGKLLVRNPWLTGRPIRIYEGWATSGHWWPEAAIVHYFQIRDIQGPNDGQVKITAAGPLQLINLTDAECPAPSAGVLSAAITDIATAAQIHDPVIAGDYPASGHLRIGDEVMAYTRSGQDLTMTRAALGTTAEAHDADDAIQLCVRYVAQPITTILADLLTTYGGVSPALLDTAAWETERSTWLGLYDLTGTISQPTKVLDLVRELLEAAGAVLWWDDQAGLVRFRAVRPALLAAATWTDAFHLLSRPQSRADLTERVSRCDVAMDLRNPAKDPKNLSSYRVRLVGIPAGEEVTQHGSSKPKVLATRWLASSQTTLARRASWLVTSQLRDGRRTIVVEVSAKDAGVQIGEVVALSSRDLIDRRGQPETTRGLVIKREAINAGSSYRYTLERLALNQRFIYLCPTGLPTYASASAAQRDPGWFLSDGTGFGANDPPYVLG